jgi:fatty-acyl-CoA synthase
VADYGVGSWPWRRARIDASAIALRQGEHALTYGELAERVDRVAAALRTMSVGPGDRVAYLGPNDIAGFELFFAVTGLGAIFSPYNTRLTAHEIAVLVADSQPRLIVVAPELTDTAAGTGVAVLRLGADYEAAVAGASPARPDTEVALDDDAMILYTSGTTGRPKGAVLTHGNITFNVMNQLAHADVLSTDIALCICPLFHATGFGQVTLPTLFKGGTVVVQPRFDPAAVLRAIDRLHISSFAAVPTMLQMLCDHPDFAGTDLSSLRYVIYGGAAVAERVALAWQRRGVAIMQGYGMTEAAPGVYLAPVAGSPERPVSVGKPHFFTDVAFDPAVASAPPGSSGELLVRGLNVFRGYWHQPDDTAAAFTGQWYRSGDVVRVDDDGWAYVTDRIKDLIISGGENVYPSEVEAAINALPGVVDCAVIAVPDERWGEVGAAFVIADEGAWTEDTLRARLGQVIAGFKVPKYVRFVSEMPRTATGKVRKRELREGGFAE